MRSSPSPPPPSPPGQLMTTETEATRTWVVDGVVAPNASPFLCGCVCVFYYLTATNSATRRAVRRRLLKNLYKCVRWTLCTARFRQNYMSRHITNVWGKIPLHAAQIDVQVTSKRLTRMITRCGICYSYTCPPSPSLQLDLLIINTSSADSQLHYWWRRAH